MKNKIRTTSFWLGLGGAIVIFLDSIASLFGFSIPSKGVESVITAIAVILIAVGFVTKKTESGNVEKVEDLLEEVIKKDDENIGDL